MSILLCASTLRGQSIFMVANSAEAYPCTYILYAGKVEVTGPLIYGGNATAVNPSWSGKIVLVDRSSGTSFLAKLNNVKNSGGLAMVLANNVAAPFTPSLGEANTTTFPAVSVTQSNGLLLRQKAGQIVKVGYTAPGSTPMPAPVKVGSRVLLTAELKGKVYPSPTFKWFKDNQEIVGANCATLFLNEVTSQHAGSYTVEVRNVAGFVVSPPDVLVVVP